MRRMRLAENQPTAKAVYVILRVFNLGKKDMGIWIYVDPASLEREGRLLFEADTYTVTVPAGELEEPL